MREHRRGELPPGWEWSTVRDALQNHDHARVPVKAADRAKRQGEYPYYGASGAIDTIDDFLFDGSHLLIGEDGANLLARSKPIAFQAHGKFWVNNHAHVLTTYCGMPLGYIEAYFNSIDLAPYVTGTAQPKLPQAAMNKIPIPIAPRPEQERLVESLDSYFSRLDDAVATLERVQRNLKRYRASVLKAAVEGRLVPTEAELARKEGRDYEPADVLLARILKERKAPWIEQEVEKGRARAEAKATKAGKPWTKADDEAALDKARAAATKKYKEPAAPDTSQLPELPEGWCWATVDQLASDEPRSLTDGPFGSNLKTAHYTDAGPRVVRLQNIGDGEFKEAEAHISEGHYSSLVRHAVYAGDLVISSLGEHLPRACIVPEWLGPAIVKADCIRFAPAQKLVVNEFVMHALNANPTRKRTEKLVHGVGRPRIGLTLLRQVPLPLPPRHEQERIAAEVERALSVTKHILADLSVQSDRLPRLRQSILKWAFEGKLVDQDPNDEPASLLLDRIKAERETVQAAAKAKAKKKPARKPRKRKSA